MPASAEVRNSTILRGERGQKKKKTTTTSDLRKEKREEKKKKKKKLGKFSSSAGEYDRLDAVAAAAALEP
jgi:ribosome assembly protein YihI (activator of Der GTPase)